MKLWIVETFRAGKWRLLPYRAEYEHQYPAFSLRDDARTWLRRRRLSQWTQTTRFRIRRVELPGVEG